MFNLKGAVLINSFDEIEEIERKDKRLSDTNYESYFESLLVEMTGKEDNSKKPTKKSF